MTRGELNRRFLSAIPRSARVLEVGCNEGNQLCALHEMGFRNLFGIEIQDYALRKARTRLESAQLVQSFSRHSRFLIRMASLMLF